MDKCCFIEEISKRSSAAEKAKQSPTWQRGARFRSHFVHMTNPILGGHGSVIFLLELSLKRMALFLC